MVLELPLQGPGGLPALDRLVGGKGNGSPRRQRAAAQHHRQPEAPGNPAPSRGPRRVMPRPRDRRRARPRPGSRHAMPGSRPVHDPSPLARRPPGRPSCGRTDPPCRATTRSTSAPPWAAIRSWACTPQPPRLYEAGRITEPPVCEPMARGTRPAATAAAEPADDPPGVWPGALGLRVPVGCRKANSVVVLLPMTNAPA